MDASPSLDSVYQAVITLYHNHNSTEKEKASQWLGELQRSVYSWKIADELLQERRDVESCYFAAQTMRTKIQYAFHELPSEAHVSLRDSLINHLEQVNESTNNVIVTQLCLALAALSLQMSSWHKPVLDLISRFSEKSIWPLLEVMTVLPEEVNSRSLRLGANRRNQILEELSACAPIVCEFLKVCLTSCGDNVQVHLRVLRCFTSWISAQAISLSDVSDSLVVAHAFNILSNHQSSSQVHDAATECVCSLLQSLEGNNNQQGLEEQLFRGVIALEESYHLSVAHEDQDKSMNYCRIFTELGESFLDKIVSSSNSNKTHFALKILDLVLMCVGHHDYEVAEITFNMWYRLSEDLYQRKHENLFKPYVERLIESLCRHSRMEPDHEGLLEDRDDFSDFRAKVSELIKDVVFIVGSSNCFRQMFLSLQGPDVTWDTTEAALFVMQAVAKNIIPEENDVVPQVVNAILMLDEKTIHTAVRHTSVLLLGELCEWIEKHSDEMLNPVLNFLLSCLYQPQLASASANALQSICTACWDKMSHHFEPLVKIVQELDSLGISNQAAIGLLKGVAVIVSKLPLSETPEAMRRLCWVQVEPLRHLVEGDIKIEKNKHTDPVLYLDRLACLFRHTNPILGNHHNAHPCVAVLLEVWPVLSLVMNRYQADVRIMERCCRCLRFGVRCVGKQSAHLLQPVATQIVTLYNVYKHSCFLYLGSIFVDEYSCEPECVKPLLEMLQSYIQPTFDLLQEENGLKNHPDTVDDFFRLCSRYIQRLPVPFLQSLSLPAILQCALLACPLDHRDANASIMKFFYDLIVCGRNHKERADFEIRRTLIEALVKEHGQCLVHNLLQASVHYLQSYMLSGVADVILELMDHDRNAVRGWLEEVLKTLPTHNSGGAVTATQTQLQDFHQAVIRAESVKQVSHLLREFSRLYR